MNIARHIRYGFLAGSLTLAVHTASAQAPYPVTIHSHNDYTRTVPFYQAYAQQVQSIEVDLFYRNGNFYVAHTEEEIDTRRTFRSLYLEPVLALYDMNKGHAWAESNQLLQLMIEIKSDNTDDFMKALVNLLDQYPDVFNPEKNPQAVRVVITGRVPRPEDFSRYPSYLRFDGDMDMTYTPEQLQRVALYSLDFGSLSIWNGKGMPIHADRERLQEAIRRAHAAGKPIRFWGAPDGKTAWNTLYTMGADYVNTDRVEQCADFFANWHNKNYGIGTAGTDAVAGGITGTDRLDKTTHDFAGFRNERLQLTRPIEFYTPTYRQDGASTTAKNVILLIGDGMGLAQITAADRVNGGLAMLLMKYMGLISTSALDAFTTDSAGAGSALATGEQNANRHISMSMDGKAYPSLTDFFADSLGRAAGIVTLGNIADATPAAFYGHTTERDSAELLTRQLLDSPLRLLAGSGQSLFVNRTAGLDLKQKLREKGFRFTATIDSLDTTPGRVICLDECMGQAADTATIGMLAETTRRAIRQLQATGDKGFFLLVEGAKIDYAGHSNCFPASIVETLGFDMAVQEALKFADSNGETLVLVTGDHETGGLTLIDGENATGHMTAVYVTDDHTPIMLPIFAYGPQADRFIGRYANYEVARRIRALFR